MSEGAPKTHKACSTCTHIQARSHSLTSRCIFFKGCICREACGPNGRDPSCLLMGRFSLYSFHSGIPLSSLPPRHTNTLLDDGSRGWRPAGATSWKERLHFTLRSFLNSCFSFIFCPYSSPPLERVQKDFKQEI